MSLDHARVAFGALETFLEAYGDNRLFEFSTVGLAFTVGMPAVSVLVAVKEMQHIVRLSTPSDTSMQASNQIKTAVRTTQALGRIWKKGAGELEQHRVFLPTIRFHSSFAAVPPSLSTAKFIEAMAALVCTDFGNDPKLMEMTQKWSTGYYGENFDANKWNAIRKGTKAHSIFEIGSRKIGAGIQRWMDDFV
ncbi:hypothetical protein M427DRAFT_443793 [Gonapodya prolifera JEL478]|uniref:Uncharacterized protein n=1 Tax=Gonapodya prolifera (strain JEL478) TaxID=1344416 RepID=A0A139A2Y4_GONPJ|nr:hypothetical protein M427DRAFT_443793 [Gonapodya prolifera JEL478]|eukprot:KXS11166.1 hypothetical protein M427DRAFT_443793 [Gonapodya prolifera JEL478]